MGQGQKSLHATPQLVICDHLRKIIHLEVQVLHSRHGNMYNILAVLTANPQPNDPEDTGQGQKCKKASNAN